jgi:PAS domain-containing protein
VGEVEKKLRSEELYDAILDDEAFEHLPGRIVEAFGARSCVLHWRHSDDAPEIMAHNRYWSDSQLKNYADNFTASDLWAVESMHPHRVNKVWNFDDVVASATLDRSVYYNELIRPMGDDTFHCLGIALSVPAGVGLIGMHKGRTQGGFTADSLRALEESVPHLRRVFMLRGRLSAATRKARLVETLLDRAKQAVITLSPTGRVLYVSAAAETIVARNDGFCIRNGRLYAAGVTLQDAVARAMSPTGSESTTLSLDRPGGARYDITISPLKMPNEPRCVLIEIRDHSPDEVESRVRVLSRTLFGLSWTI